MHIRMLTAGLGFAEAFAIQDHNWLAVGLATVALAFFITDKEVEL